MCESSQCGICRRRILHRLCSGNRSADTQRYAEEVFRHALLAITKAIADDISVQQTFRGNYKTSLVPS